jgi:hypothetical protein
MWATQFGGNAVSNFRVHFRLQGLPIRWFPLTRVQGIISEDIYSTIHRGQNVILTEMRTVYTVFSWSLKKRVHMQGLV